MNPSISYRPLQGKTFSLFADDQHTKKYYLTISRLADQYMALHGLDPLLEVIGKRSVSKRRLRYDLDSKRPGDFQKILQHLHQELSVYTRNAPDHLKRLPRFQQWNRRLGTSVQQYLLFMMEIELTNRKYKTQFLETGHRIALLPYCLRDHEADCMAENNAIGEVCRHCSKKCFIQHASIIFRKYNINAYVRMRSDLKKSLRSIRIEGKTLGVFGIGCIPELVRGMRTCRKMPVPVMGMPLNANRCHSWMGKMHETSIDLENLEELLSADHRL